MCIGVPLLVDSVEAGGNATCLDESAPSGRRTVATVLLDPPPSPGQWVLVHIDVAVCQLEPSEAREIADALAAAAAAAEGQPFEHLLGDLAGREPQLPPHLRSVEHRKETSDV